MPVENPPPDKRDSEAKCLHDEIQRPEFQNRLWRSYHVPPLFMSSTIKNYQPKNTSQKRAKRLCHAYSENTRTTLSLFLHGPTGTGKTHLAVGALKIICKNWPLAPQGLFESAGWLMMMARDAMTTDGISITESLEEYFEAGILVIDDLDKTNATTFRNRVLHSIIDARYVDRRPTVITAQDPPHALGLGSATLDRIRGDFKILEVEGNSYR